MESYIFITLMIFSPWPLFYAIMFYYAGISDKKFSFFITKKSQIYKYVGVIICLGLFVSYIFIYRLANTTRIIDLYLIKDNILFIIGLLSLSDIIIFGLFIIFVILGWWSTLSWLYICLRRRLIALHLYFYQYNFYYNIMSLYINVKLDFLLYSVDRVMIFTNNDKIIEIANIIWPHLFFDIEKIIFRFLLPYLIIYDILVHDCRISIIFYTLPWFYIYFIFRTTISFIDKTHTATNDVLSEKMYGYDNR